MVSINFSSDFPINGNFLLLKKYKCKNKSSVKYGTHTNEHMLCFRHKLFGTMRSLFDLKQMNGKRVHNDTFIFECIKVTN